MVTILEVVSESAQGDDSEVIEIVVSRKERLVHDSVPRGLPLRGRRGNYHVLPYSAQTMSSRIDCDVRVVLWLARACVTHGFVVPVSITLNIGLPCKRPMGLP
jgi:hypothetical protein